MTYLVDPTITRKWWTELLADEARMIAWLQKLQVTEIDGYAGNFETNARWNTTGNRNVEVFLIQTARDELRHSELLTELLADRGVEPLADQSPTSLYWDRMEAKVTCLEDMLAVFHLGERLASKRFEVIGSNPATPNDVLQFIWSALPDETMHAHGYARLAGEEAIARMRIVHDEVMAGILGRRLVA